VKLEFGFQPGHSEDMVLIAHFQTPEEAEKAMCELALFLSEIDATSKAADELHERFGEKESQEYLKEANKRWKKLCNSTDIEDGLDWSTEDARIGTQDKQLRFTVYSAGYGLDAVSNFLMKHGATSVEDEDTIGTSSIEYIVEEFKKRTGLSMIIDKGLMAVERKNAKKTRSKRS